MLTIKVGLTLTLIGLKLISIPDNNNVTGAFLKIIFKEIQI